MDTTTTNNNGARLPRQPEPHQRSDGPRRLPFWEMGTRSDMGETLSAAVRYLTDEAILRPVALYALHAGLTAHFLGEEAAGFEWDAKGADVLSALKSLGGRLFMVDGESHYVAWPSGMAHLRISPATGEVWRLELATCDEALLAAVQEARKGWLRPVAPEAPTTTINVLVKSGSNFGLTEITSEDSTLVEGNYAPSTVEAYRRAAAALRSPKPSGRLLVLEGKTGTGKTHMVRALLGALAGAATVILVPEHLVANLAEPAIVPVLVNIAQRSGGDPIVLVLEDCDDCLLSREHTTAQGDRANVATLSAVLNLADG